MQYRLRLVDEDDLVRFARVEADSFGAAVAIAERHGFRVEPPEPDHEIRHGGLDAVANFLYVLSAFSVVVGVFGGVFGGLAAAHSSKGVVAGFGFFVASLTSAALCTAVGGILRLTIQNSRALDDLLAKLPPLEGDESETN